VEDKYDGIRASACVGRVVKFFSRTRDEITESFPELPDALAGLPRMRFSMVRSWLGSIRRIWLAHRKVVDESHLKRGR